MFSPFLGFEKGIQKQGPGLPGLCGVWLAAREVFEFKLQRDLPFDDWDFSHLGAAFFLALLVSIRQKWIFSGYHRFWHFFSVNMLLFFKIEGFLHIELPQSVFHVGFQ